MSVHARDDRLPWQAGPAILEVLRAWQGEEPCSLPDEPPSDANQIRWAPGAWDGVLGHHTSGVDEQEEARLVTRLLDALLALVADEDDPARSRLYEMLIEETLVRHIDVILHELISQPALGPADVVPHARWLVQQAAHRNPLKFGIALLGVCGDASDLDDLRTLARHDEFTLYAAVAGANLSPAPIDLWWEMAQEVHGWGKVHLVERLCLHVEDRPDIQGWLLRHGCTNSVMNEYLACACALAGDLTGALREPDVDDALLDGAAAILEGLLSPFGPAGDIDSYDAAPDALEAFLNHMAHRCTTLRRLHVVVQIRDWLRGEEEAWKRRLEGNWTAERRRELLEDCETILARPEWPARIRSAFAGDETERWLAWPLGKGVGVDLWEEAFAQLHQTPQDCWLYQILLETEDEARAEQVIELAEHRLPLMAIATGPANLLGLGKEFEAHQCLDSLLVRMQKGVQFSETLVATALRSPVVRNRHQAAAVLRAHPGERWGERVRAALAQTRCDETEASLRDQWNDAGSR